MEVTHKNINISARGIFTTAKEQAQRSLPLYVPLNANGRFMDALGKEPGVSKGVIICSAVYGFSFSRDRCLGLLLDKNNKTS